MPISRHFLTLALVVASPAPVQGAPPAKECEVVAYLIQQARIDFALLKGKQVAKGRCKARAAEFGCSWAFPGDAFGPAEEETARLKRCVAAYPGARQADGRRAAEYLLEPDLSVTIPAPEIDGDGNWSVGFRMKLKDTP